MAADLFETYAVTIVATMLLAAIFFAPPLRDKLLLLPLVIGAVCIVTSVIGTYFVRLGADNGIMKALYKVLDGLFASYAGERLEQERFGDYLWRTKHLPLRAAA